MKATRRRTTRFARTLAGALTNSLGSGPTIVLAGLIVAFLALRYAEPIPDGDLFFHLAYAKQMLARGTLVTDHTLYSWTPSSNATIYCAWLAELVLYGLWSALGLAAVFALRYAFVAFAALLVWQFAQRNGLARAPVTALVLVAIVQFVQAGALPKPEMFSLVLFTTMVLVYATGRWRVARGLPAARWFYAIPAIMLVWVDTHGGFILAPAFLAAVAVGEVGLFIARAEARLPGLSLLDLLAAWSLCVPITAATPYGIAYPLQLIHDYTSGLASGPEAAANIAYRSIFDPTADGGVLIGGLCILCGALVVLWILAWRARGHVVLRWLPLSLAALAYVPLYVAFLRSTQLLPVVAAFLMIALAAEAKGETAPASAAAGPPARARVHSTRVAGGLAALLACAGIADIWLQPSENGWVGFGINAVSPVAEAEFLARQKLGPDLYNTFNNGGYLLWRLWPAYKVMVDSRAFPFSSWFQDQYDFSTGKSFASFLRKYPARVAVAELSRTELWRNFMNSPEWRLVFYGSVAAVFIRTEDVPRLVAITGSGDPDRFSILRSPGAAIRVFEFATFIGDYRSASRVLDAMRGPLHMRLSRQAMAQAEAYMQAFREIRAKEYAAALDHLGYGLVGRAVSNRDDAVVTLLVALTQASAPLDEDGRRKVVEALDRIAPPL